MEIWRNLLAQAPEIPVPASLDWSVPLLLTVIWVFVAAAVAGPLVQRWSRRDRAPDE